MNLFIDALVVFLPAGVANMAPVLANKIPGLNRWETPVDFGHTWRGVRIFGDHKTWRGITTGVFAGTIFSIVWYLVSGTRGVADAAVLGFLLAFGALAGDAVKSFAKRRIGHMSGGKAKGIPSGKSWFPFDQIDYIVGALLLSWPVLQPSLALVTAIVVMYFGLHLAATYLGYRLGLKSDPI